MRIAMLASGTRGDVQPMVAIGDELARRGHEVAVAVNSDLADWVTRAGLRAVPTGVDFKRFLSSAESRRMLAHGKVDTTIRRIVADEHRVNQQIVNACVRAAEGADVILTTVTMSLRGLCLEKATGVPSRILYSFPIVPTGDFSGIMPRVRDFRMAWANRGGSRMLNQLYWMRNKANLDEMSDLMGAPRVSRMPRQEERPGLHLYSPRVVPEPTDLPGGHELIGFPVLSDDLRDRLGERTVPAELDRWLDAGPEPVYFGFGSMPVLDPERTLRELIEVTARRGIRGLVGAGASWAGTPTACPTTCSSPGRSSTTTGSCPAAGRRCTTAARERRRRRCGPVSRRWWPASSPTSRSGAGGPNSCASEPPCRSAA
ncbi:glycosyltransferase [Actinomadura namibiensis]|uniref:glycosyltransferase n=1 Tax=Actinomadura kijaniata TaxID=46161 RepID=UPI00360A25B1